EVGSSRPMIIRIVVDLPAPFGPRKPVTLPGWMVKLMPSVYGDKTAVDGISFAAGVDGEADAVHSGLVAVAFGEILRLDHADPSVCWWSPNSTAVGAADTRRPRHRSAGAERSLRRAGADFHVRNNRSCSESAQRRKIMPGVCRRRSDPAQP